MIQCEHISDYIRYINERNNETIMCYDSVAVILYKLNLHELK